MYQSVDVSWPQQNYHPGSESGVIVAATSGDTASGSLFTQATFVEDVANARAAGKEVGFYHFNGGNDPTGSARYFWSVIAPYFRPGDIVILDVESWQTGTRPAWSPGQAAVFANELARLRALTTEQSRLGIYGNRSDMRAPGWGALEKSGSWLFLAAPGGYPENTPVGEWSHWTILQYSSAGGVDRDESEQTFAQIANQENDMTPEEHNMLQAVHDAIFKGGDSMPDAGRSIGQSLQGLTNRVSGIGDLVEQPVERAEGTITQAADNVVTGTLVRHLASTGVPVDVNAVAAAVAAQLPASGASLTPEQVKQAVIEGVSALTIKATV